MILNDRACSITCRDAKRNLSAVQCVAHTNNEIPWADILTANNHF